MPAAGMEEGWIEQAVEKRYDEQKAAVSQTHPPAVWLQHLNIPKL